MNTAIKILCGTLLALAAVSCEKEVASTPKAAMTVNKNQLIINESMEVCFTGEADQVVVYTGDEMHRYELRQQSNTGFVVNKGLFTYAYSVPGIYKVVCIASTYTDRAEDLKRDTCSFTVTVIDNETEIRKISCPQILYDEVFAEKHPNDEWLMKLPRKLKYNNQTPAISLSQRLRFYIDSDSSHVFVNEKAYSATDKYDLAAPIDIRVKSNFGTTRPYKLYTLNYPEFATFRLLGVNGTLQRSEYDYSTFVIELTLPTGTNVSNLIPTFTTSAPQEKAYIENTEQASGTSPVDFTKEVTYRLVSTLADHPSMQATSNVTVKINYR